LNLRNAKYVANIFFWLFKQSTFFTTPRWSILMVGGYPQALHSYAGYNCCFHLKFCT
jgi:hypothetical protein